MEKKLSTEQVAIRLPVELLARLAAYAETMRAKMPGVTVTRTDTIRSILEAGLRLTEKAKK